MWVRRSCMNYRWGRFFGSCSFRRGSRICMTNNYRGRRRGRMGRRRWGMLGRTKEKSSTLVLDKNHGLDNKHDYRRPVSLGCKKWFLQHHAKIFVWWEKNFCSLRIFSIFAKTHFFTQRLIFKVFEKFMRWASKIFAWWGKISAGCKNLHPWFCSPEKPHSCVPFYKKGTLAWLVCKGWMIFVPLRQVKSFDLFAPFLGWYS